MLLALYMLVSCARPSICHKPVLYHVGWVEIGDLQPVSCYISETVQDRDIVIMEGY